MVTEQVPRVLGIEAADYPLATFKQLREHLTSGARTAFRTGWRGEPAWVFINVGGLGHGVQPRFQWNGLPDYQTIWCDAGAGAGHDRS